MIAYDFKWDAVFANGDLLQAGLRYTLYLAAVSMVLAAGFGLILALMRTSRFGPLRWIATIYINVVRGIPLLVLLIWVYFGLPLFLGVDPATFTKFRAGVISLAVFHSAFMAEVFRTGLTAVAAGQREAALSIGMSRPRAFTSIILPQAVRVAVPAGGNDFVGMVKDTSLVGIIGVAELYRNGQTLVNDTFLPFEIWTAVSALYIATVFLIDLLVHLVERRLRPSSRARGLLARRRNAAIDKVVRRITATAPASLPPTTIPTNPAMQ
jgi:His/Glu/Gln/Arg/opine family amino acid ABC transporter permease subunit